MVSKSELKRIISDDLSAIWTVLNGDEKHLIASNFAIQSYGRGELLYTEGEAPHQLWCLLRGKVKLHKSGIGGKPQILRLYRPIQYFGYRAWFAGERYVSSASAIEAVQVGVVPMTVVKELIDRNRQLAWFFIHELSRHLGGSDTKMVTLTQKHLRGRLAEALCMMLDNYGFEEDGQTLRICMAREDIANLSNMTTANAIRTLSSFAQERLITVDGRRIRIIDESRLRTISQQG